MASQMRQTRSEPSDFLRNLIFHLSYLLERTFPTKTLLKIVKKTKGSKDYACEYSLKKICSHFNIRLVHHGMPPFQWGEKSLPTFDIFSMSALNYVLSSSVMADQATAEQGLKRAETLQDFLTVTPSENCQTVYKLLQLLKRVIPLTGERSKVFEDEAKAIYSEWMEE